jgi:hypothetical protein
MSCGGCCAGCAAGNGGGASTGNGVAASIDVSAPLPLLPLAAPSEPTPVTWTPGWLPWVAAVIAAALLLQEDS